MKCVACIAEGRIVVEIRIGGAEVLVGKAHDVENRKIVGEHRARLFYVVVRLARPRENQLGLFSNLQVFGVKSSRCHAPFARAGHGVCTGKPRLGKKLVGAINKFFAAHCVYCFVVTSGNGRGIGDAVFRLHRIRHHNRPAGFLRNEAGEFANRRGNTGAAVRKNQCRITVAEVFVCRLQRRRFNHVFGILLLRQHQKRVVPNCL